MKLHDSNSNIPVILTGTRTGPGLAIMVDPVYIHKANPQPYLLMIKSVQYTEDWK